jgi:hypothetical protein
MKSNIWILIVMAAYFTLATIAYGIWSTLEFGQIEIIGTAAMAMLVILSVFVAFYLNNANRRAGVLPEDNLDGEIADESGEVGFYSPWSWWPFFVGASAAVAFASLAVGWWLFFVALPFALVAVVGFVFEYSRGAHAH